MADSRPIAWRSSNAGLARSGAGRVDLHAMSDQASAELRACGECVEESHPTDFPPHEATVIRRALLTLYPWSMSAALRAQQFKGRHAAILAMVNHRVSVDTIRQWEYGRRSAPRWFVKIVYDELVAQGRARLAMAELLAAQPSGPGRAAPLTAYRQRKRAAG